jgi:hypothetical protein
MMRDLPVYSMRETEGVSHHLPCVSCLRARPGLLVRVRAVSGDDG